MYEPAAAVVAYEICLAPLRKSLKAIDFETKQSRRVYYGRKSLPRVGHEGTVPVRHEFSTIDNTGRKVFITFSATYTYITYVYYTYIMCKWLHGSAS